MSSFWEPLYGRATRSLKPSPIREMLHLTRRPGIISFAGGIHSCLGMHLARVESKAMLNSLFDRVTDLQLIPDEDTQIVGMPFRSPATLPVTFRPLQDA